MNMDALSAIAFVAERKIEEAIAEGQFDNLPGIGKPLVCEDLGHLPPDMRMAYRMLKSGGFLDKAPEPGKPVAMRDLLSDAQEEKAAYGKLQRFKLMMSRVHKAREKSGLPCPAHASDSRGPEKADAVGKAFSWEGSPYLGALLKKV